MSAARLLITPLSGWETRIVAVADPGVEVPLVYPVRGWQWWQLVSVSALWAQGAGVANLTPTVTLASTGVTALLVSGSFFIIGAVTMFTNFAVGLSPSQADTGIALQALPDIMFTGDGQVTLGFAAGNVGARSVTNSVLGFIGRRYVNTRA